jgi:hypothetical protein
VHSDKTGFSHGGTETTERPPTAAGEDRDTAIERIHDGHSMRSIAVSRSSLPGEAGPLRDPRVSV